MKLLAIAIGFFLAASATPVFANVPVNDAAQLTQRSETASTTVTLVPITTQRQDANKGVRCAVTTGKKANVTNPTVQPSAGAGVQAIQAYGPNLPATPDTTVQGATLNLQTLFQSAGNVVGGVDASRSTTVAAQSAFRTASQEVGTADTVMGALDMNSAARLQNNLGWNGVIGSTNLWLTALNALNIAATSDTSRAAGGMQAAVTTQQTASGQVCPVGMIGAGTAADPCRVTTTCQTTPPGSAPDPACVSARYVDTDSNVLSYLDQIQDAARAASASSQ